MEECADEGKKRLERKGGTGKKILLPKDIRLGYEMRIACDLTERLRGPNEDLQ